jgi:DNA-binding beta-propeller fold protein YncE
LKPPRAILRIIWLLLPVLLGTGCALQTVTEYKPPLGDQGELYLYLQPLPQEMLPLTFTISDLALISEQGTTIPLIEEELPITGRDLVNIQKRLLAKTLAPGRYSGVSLTISRATVATEEGGMDLLPPAQPILLDLDFTVFRGRAQALFVALSPEYLVTDGIRFTPRFALARPHQHPKNYLGFISNTGANVVTVFHKRTMEIVQVIYTGIGPRGMALDRNRGIVYVALSGEDAIGLISVDSMEQYGTIKLRFGDEPIELALSPGGETLLAANYGSGTVSIIDTRSRLETLRLGLDPDPVWVVAGREGQKAYVLHGLPNSLSVIDLSNRRLQSTISLEESPWRAAMNRDGNRLFIVSPYATDLQILRTDSRSIAGTIFTGAHASSITVDPRNDLVYIGKKTGEVVVADPLSGTFIDSFPVPGDAGFLTIDGEENMLLVLSATRNTLHKFNLVSKRKLTYVPTEKGAHAVVVMGEL